MSDHDETVAACPECDCADIYSNVGNRSDTASYHCRHCGADFDDYVERARKGPGGIRGDTIAGVLDRADPDELLSDAGTLDSGAATPANSDVVDTLLDVDVGNELDLVAEHYDWANPFEVVDVDEHTWHAATGDCWRSRTIKVDPAAPQGTPKALDVVAGSDPPHMGAYGALVDVRVTGTAAPSNGHIDWLARPAAEIVATSSVERSVTEVLDVIQTAESILEVHQRLAAPSLSATKQLLWELGLREKAGGLLASDDLNERIDTLREADQHD